MSGICITYCINKSWFCTENKQSLLCIQQSYVYTVYEVIMFSACLLNILWIDWIFSASVLTCLLIYCIYVIWIIYNTYLYMHEHVRLCIYVAHAAYALFLIFVQVCEYFVIENRKRNCWACTLSCQIFFCFRCLAYFACTVVYTFTTICLQPHVKFSLLVLFLFFDVFDIFGGLDG